MAARGAPASHPAPRSSPQSPPHSSSRSASRSSLPRLPLREFRRIDLNAEDAGVSIRHLMGRAGKALAGAVLARRRGDAPVWLLCGKGNNGGDGFAAAGILLKQGVTARVLLVEPAEKVVGQASRSYLNALPQGTVQAWNARLRPPAGTVLVDCLLGSGIRGEPRPPHGAAIKWLRARKARHPVVACDVPSGLGARLAVVPHETVTFHAAKEGMTRRNSGTITVADIGIPREAAERVGFGDLATAYPPHGKNAHKGDHGRLLVIGGGPFTGAPHYAAAAAYRTGVDLAFVAAPARAAAVIEGWGPGPLVHAVDEAPHLTVAALPAVEALMGRADAVVLGPGLGDHPDTLAAATACLDAVARRGLPVVVDADGLDAVTPAFLRRHGTRTVLTPHAREFADLAGTRATDAEVVAYAARHRTVVVRKGEVDIVTDGTTTRTCHRGHPTMTVGGTGDVLAGAIGALLAKGVEPLDAAAAGTYLVGCAGEVAAGILGMGATATDIQEAIPAVLRRVA